MATIKKNLLLCCLALSIAAQTAIAAPKSLEATFEALESDPGAITYLSNQSLSNNHRASFYLGVAAEIGKGMPRNLEAAMTYYRIAAIHVPEAAFNAGRLLYLAKQPDEAAKYFVQAAGNKTGGLTQAMVMLGRLYEQGELVTGKNLVAAARWYEEAARRQEPNAIWKMGEFYAYGYGRPVNAREAKIYLERAARMGVVAAQNTLGDLHANAKIEGANPTDAGKWYLIASSQSQDIKSVSASYLSSLSDMEMTTARRMAELWISANPPRLIADPLGMISRLK